MSVTCSRAGCNEEAVCFSGKNKRYGYCERHQSIINRRSNALALGKEVPTWEWFESRIDKTNMHCEQCNKKMKFRGNGKSGSRSDVYSLQHHPDGSMALVCVPCNSRLGVLDAKPSIRSKTKAKGGRTLMRARVRPLDWIILLEEEVPEKAITVEFGCPVCGVENLLDVVGTMKWQSKGLFAMTEHDFAWTPSEIMCPICKASFTLSNKKTK